MRHLPVGGAETETGRERDGQHTGRLDGGSGAGVTVAQVAAGTGLCLRSVYRALHKLQRLGLIAKIADERVPK